MTNIVDRATAQSLGLKRYFTGESCRNGHVSERGVGNRECIMCALERSVRDPNKAARTKASAQRHREKRNEWRRDFYAANRDRLKEYHADLRTAQIEKYKAREAGQRLKRAKERRVYAAHRYATNREAVAAATRKWAQNNKAKVAARTARRKAALLRATPAWADHAKIQEFYDLSRKLTIETGILHEVDHIDPLQGRLICGLHVHTNLRVITKSENSRKKNHWQDMIDAALNSSTTAPNKDQA